jgi:hypothetical protein
MSFRYSACFSLSSPNIRSVRTSEKPMMAFRGVRSSCDMLARNSDLWRLAASSCRLLSSISRNSRAFWIARADWVAKVLRTSMTSGAKSPGVFLATVSPPMTWPLAQERNRQERTEPGAEQDVAESARVGTLRGDVGNLDGLARHRHAALGAFSASHRRLSGGGNHVLIEVVRGAQVELLGPLVVLEDRAPVGAGELVGPGDDRIEHGLELKRGAEGLADLTQRLKLLDRASELAGPRLQLGEQPRVLDADHGLVSEDLQQFDLAVREVPGFYARHDYDADGGAVPQHRDVEATAMADRVR